MIALIVSKMMDGEFKVTEGYFDQGGLKMINGQGIQEVDWAATLAEVAEDVGRSMYRSSQHIDVSGPDEVKKFLGQDTAEFVQKLGNRFIDL